jgi:hypothetical protein
MTNFTPKQCRVSSRKSSSVRVHAKASKSLGARSCSPARLSSGSLSISSNQGNGDDPIEVDDVSSVGDGDAISSDLDPKKQLGASTCFLI